MTVRRSGPALITLLAMLTQVFFLVRIVRGDPAQMILGDQASLEVVLAMRVHLGPVGRCWRDTSNSSTALRDWGDSAWIFASPSLGNSIGSGGISVLRWRACSPSVSRKQGG